MKLELRTDIQAYYDFSNCCNDDLEFITILLQLPKLKPNKTTLNNLENLRVSKYENDFNFLLDNLQITTIKNLYSIYQLNQGLTDGNE
ncbi:hypothetical protein ACOTVT_10130 [Aliarcobacter butzleri]